MTSRLYLVWWWQTVVIDLKYSFNKRVTYFIKQLCEVYIIYAVKKLEYGQKNNLMAMILVFMTLQKSDKETWRNFIRIMFTNYEMKQLMFVVTNYKEYHNIIIICYLQYVSKMYHFVNISLLIISHFHI